MARKQRRKHSPLFKSKAALAALKVDQTFAELAAKFEVDPKSNCRIEATASGNRLSRLRTETRKGKKPDIQRMQAKIVQLTLENDLLEDTLSKAGMLSARK